MSRTRYITQAGMIAAVYAGLTFLTMQVLQIFSWGLVQLRLSEAFTVVAMLTPAGIPGLTLGTFLANLLNVAQFGPIGWLDVFFGSAGTLIGAIWMWRFKDNRPLALFGPVLSNALVVPAYLPIILMGLGLYEVPLLGWDLEGSWVAMYLFGLVAVGAGQAVVVYGLGWPLLTALERLGIRERI